MSVQMNQYLAYGYLLPYEESEKTLKTKYSEDQIEELFENYHDSAFDKEIVEINGCSLISDGMNGEYNFFGKILKKSDVYEPMETIVIPKVSGKIKKNVEEEFLKVFGTNFEIKPELILLTHYR
jgi:hypothetical protein